MDLKVKYIVPLIIFTFYSCNFITNYKNEEKVKTYFGGKIINPKSSHIILSDQFNVIDSIKLNEDNTFSSRLENIKEGLYFFKHGPDYQYIYFEKGDSLLLRLNTWDFHESLVFSGKAENAERNNLLIQFLLQSKRDEKELNKLIPKYSTKKFVSKVNTLKKERLTKIENYINTIGDDKASPRFNDILKITSLYPLYSSLENYSIKQILKNKRFLDNSFFNYRNEATMGSDSIMFYKPYSDYFINKLYNDTYRKGHKENSGAFVSDLLQTTSEKVQTEDLRNYFLKQFTIHYFYQGSNINKLNEAFNTFFKLNTNKEYKAKIMDLLNSKSDTLTNKKLPDFLVKDLAGNTHNITDIIKNQKALIYFRNPETSPYKWITSKFETLSKENPDIFFYVINHYESDTAHIKSINSINQFTLTPNSKAKNFLTDELPRTILIDKKGIVFNGFCSISSNEINIQVSNLQKQ